MTLAATAKKLNVSFYEYVRDRILKKNAIPPLAELRLSGNRRGWVANVGQDGSLSHGDHQIWGCTTPIPNEPELIQKAARELMQGQPYSLASPDF